MPESNDNSWQWGLAASILGGMLAGFVIYVVSQVALSFPFPRGSHPSGALLLIVILVFCFLGSLLSAMGYAALARRQPAAMHYVGCLVHVITIAILLASLGMSLFLMSQR